MNQSTEIESVWDYPRPPRLEHTPQHLSIVHCGITLADTTNAMRVLETSHPPVYYIPTADIAMQFLRPSQRRGSFCEYKGLATYWTIDMSHAQSGDQASCLSSDAAWSYPEPSQTFKALQNHLAFYAGKVEACSVDGELVLAQAGDFYGGWITSRIKGPFKGAPGTMGW